MKSSPQTFLGDYSPDDLPQRFSTPERRSEQMEDAVRDWFEVLADRFPSPMSNAQIADLLRMFARAPHLSLRNAILLSIQCPEASNLGTFDYHTEFYDNTVKRGEKALYLFDTIIDKKCPGCGRGAFEHDVDRYTTPDCSSSPSVSWETGVVTTTPRAMFDESQLVGSTELPSESPIKTGPAKAGQDEYKPDFSEGDETTPYTVQIPPMESAEDLVAGFPALAAELGIAFKWVAPEEWDETALVVDDTIDCYTLEPRVRAVAHDDYERLAGSVLTKFAWVLIAYDTNSTVEVKKRQSEAQAIAYSVALACGHGTEFTLDIFERPPDFEAWSGEGPDSLRVRLERVSDGISSLLSGVIGATQASSPFQASPAAVRMDGTRTQGASSSTSLE